MDCIWVQDQFYTIQNLQRSPIPQNSNWSGTFFLLFNSYSKPALERCFCYRWEQASSLKITCNIHFKGLSQKSYLDDIRTFFKMPIPELFCSCSSANWRHAAGDIECKNLWNKSPVMSATALKGTHRFRKSTLFKEIK